LQNPFKYILTALFNLFSPPANEDDKPSNSDLIAFAIPMALLIVIGVMLFFFW
jgi:hypothetical protein